MDNPYGQRKERVKRQGPGKDGSSDEMPKRDERAQGTAKRDERAQGTAKRDERAQGTAKRDERAQGTAKRDERAQGTAKRDERAQGTAKQDERAQGTAKANQVFGLDSDTVFEEEMRWPNVQFKRNYVLGEIFQDGTARVQGHRGTVIGVKNGRTIVQVYDGNILRYYAHIGFNRFVEVRSKAARPCSCPKIKDYNGDDDSSGSSGALLIPVKQETSDEVDDADKSEHSKMKECLQIIRDFFCCC